MVIKRKANKKKPKDYMTVIQNDVMTELGRKINFYRNILNLIMERNIEDLEGADVPLILHEMDMLYQQSLDAILDSLVDCADMKLAYEACSAINKSMNVRRGLTKLEEI